MSKIKKTALTQQLIVNAGLELVSEAGMEALSFRKLADRLGVTAMALYRHFDDKEALITEMLDQFIRNAVVLPEQELPWQDWLKYVSSRMYEALVQEPSWVPLLGQIPLRTGGIEVLDRCLGCLIDAGFTREQAVQAFFSMIHCVLGAALIERQLREARAVDVTVEALAEMAPAHIASSLPQLQGILQSRQLDLSMALLLQGLYTLNKA